MEEHSRFPMLGMLEESLEDLRQRGVPTTEVEVGPMTHQFCIDLMIARREWKTVTPEMVRAQIAAGSVDLHFDGSSVVLVDDVPEGQFWPSRKVECEPYFPYPSTAQAAQR